MPSITATLVSLYVKWVLQSKVLFDSPDNTLKSLNDLHIRPKDFHPPTNLGLDIFIDRVDVHDWPLYRLSTEDPSFKKEPRKALLYIHGGAFFREIHTQHWRLTAQVARETDLDVLIPIYPLLPRPGATAQKLAAGLIDICRLSKQPVVSVAGDSAGGMLALSTCQQLRDTQPELAAQVRSLILISPVLDCALEHPEVVRLAEVDPWLGLNGLRAIMPILAGDLPVKNPIVSPLFGDMANLPPILLLSGTHDMLCADARRLKSKFAGGDVDEAPAGSVEMDRFVYIEKEAMIHVWPALPHPEGAEGRKTIIHFINMHLQE
ncbi:alpha beta-hydrolase [Fusarium beomiforme]|uniref:Alpha beta-hydrolase n=1 Tax=Fusarium beomiforme TaxID=44412 RepID=A0A9P5AQK5_9HYPO|nr:alpha beta-hydrolase [Fusarium beomiforme]